MRLLQISADCNTGSVGRIMEGIGDAVMNRGAESYIAFGRDYRPSNSQVIKIGGKLNVYTHVIKARLFDCDGLGSKFVTKKFLGQLEIINPDIIHIHCIHGYYLNYPLLFEYIKEKNIPLVWTFHDCWPFTGHCCYPSCYNCDGYKTGCLKCSSKADYPQSILSRSIRNYEQKKQCFLGINKLKIVTVSNWLKRIVRESFFSSTDTETIYNGVDLDLFKPYDKSIETKLRNKYSIPLHKNYIIGVASPWSERKGLNDYYRLRKVLDESIIMVLVGLNSNQIEELPQGIVGIPRISEPMELAKLYSSATVVMNLSSAETFGMTTAEGFACGTPCVGYNCTATPELITEGTGVIIDEGDIDGLNNAVCSIISNGKLQYMNHCRHRAELLFDKNKSFNKYVDLYNDLIKI